MFGFRENALPPSAIPSPQALQMRMLMAGSAPGEFPDHAAPVPAPVVIADSAQRMEQNPPDSVVGNHLFHTDYKGKGGQRLQRIPQRKEGPQTDSDRHGLQDHSPDLSWSEHRTGGQRPGPAVFTTYSARWGTKVAEHHLRPLHACFSLGPE